MNIVKYILIITAIALGLYLIAGVVAVGVLRSSFKETYTKNDLVNNFKTRQQQVLSLRDCCNSIVPNNKSIEIEYKSDTWLARLDAAHCISVRNGLPCRIGFQRSGMGMYFYDLFPTPMSDSVRSRYNDSCTYIAYSPTVVLEYGGGAVGPQCFSKQ